jgi:hypothetical protein
MFCEKCGAKLPEDARFCDRCGTALHYLTENAGFPGENIPKSAVPNPVLPKGILRTPEGTLFWSHPGESGMIAYYMYEDRGEIYRNSKQSKAKGLLVGLLDLADMFGGGDSERSELPSELLHSQSTEEKVISFTDVSEVRGERQNNRICVFSKNDSDCFYVTNEQYDFVSDFIVSHCRNARIV